MDESFSVCTSFVVVVVVVEKTLHFKDRHDRKYRSLCFTFYKDI